MLGATDEAPQYPSVARGGFEATLAQRSSRVEASVATPVMPKSSLDVGSIVQVLDESDWIDAEVCCAL